MSTSTLPSSDRATTIGRIAGVISADGFPTGQRAALRRISLDQPLPLPFFRFALRYLPQDWDRTADTIKDWTTIVAGIALMSPTAHRPDLRLGTALGEKGYSEARLERLLGSEGDTRRILLLRVARFLAAKASACNWLDCVLLLQLSRDSDGRENLHRRIAADFYRAVEAKTT